MAAHGKRAPPDSRGVQMGRAKLWVTAMVLAASLGGSLAAAGPAHAGTSDDEVQFVGLINQLRAGKGLGQLAVDDRLTAEARTWAATMAGTGLHHNPDIAGQAPPGWTMIGENV